MSEKLTLLVSLSSAKLQAVSSYLESAGIACYTAQISNGDTDSDQNTAIFVREIDFNKAFQLYNSFSPVPSQEDTKADNQQFFPGLFIVPVDFSPASENAGYYASELAIKFKARIKLIHTFGIPEVRPFLIDESDFYQVPAQLESMNEIKKDLEEKLNDLEVRLKKFVSKKLGEDIPISKAVYNGLPDELTLYSAESDKASLIILGLSSESSVSFGTIGKIASRIIEKSSIPVLIIPETSKIKETEKSNILYLTSFDESDFSAIHKLISTVQNLGMNVFCLHIESGVINQWDRIKMDGLKDYFKNSYKLSNVHCDLVNSDNVIKTIDDFIEINKIDIIAMVDHKRNAISRLINPGITKKVLYHSRIPLFVFHE